MSENLKQNLELIKLLANPRYRKKIILSGDKNLIAALCDIIYNVLNGNINISSTERQKLNKYKTALRCLCKKSSLREKKRILVQRGGFLQFLIPAVVTGLASIVSSWISKPDPENEVRD